MAESEGSVNPVDPAVAESAGSEPDSLGEVNSNPEVSTEQPAPSSARPAEQAEQRAEIEPAEATEIRQVVDQLARFADANYRKSINKYKKPSQGAKLFKHALRIGLKATAATAISVASGGLLAGAAFGGAIASEAAYWAVEGARAGAAKLGWNKENEWEEQLRGMDEAKLAEIGTRAKAAQDAWNTPERTAKLASLFDYATGEYKTQSQDEKDVAGKLKWTRFGWGAARTAASILSGVGVGHALAEGARAAIEHGIAENGETLHSAAGIGEIAQRDESLLAMQKLGHFVHKTEAGQWVFDYNQGEAELIEKVVNSSDTLRILPGGMHEISAEVITQAINDKIATATAEIGLAVGVADLMPTPKSSGRPYQEHNISRLEKIQNNNPDYFAGGASPGGGTGAETAPQFTGMPESLRPNTIYQPRSGVEIRDQISGQVVIAQGQPVLLSGYQAATGECLVQRAENGLWVQPALPINYHYFIANFESPQQSQPTSSEIPLPVRAPEPEANTDDDGDFETAPREHLPEVKDEDYLKPGEYWHFIGPKFGDRPYVQKIEQNRIKKLLSRKVRLPQNDSFYDCEIKAVTDGAVVFATKKLTSRNGLTYPTRDDNNTYSISIEDFKKYFASESATAERIDGESRRDRGGESGIDNPPDSLTPEQKVPGEELTEETLRNYFTAHPKQDIRVGPGGAVTIVGGDSEKFKNITLWVFENRPSGPYGQIHHVEITDIETSLGIGAPAFLLKIEPGSDKPKQEPTIEEKMKKKPGDEPGGGAGEVDIDQLPDDEKAGVKAVLTEAEFWANMQPIEGKRQIVNGQNELDSPAFWVQYQRLEKLCKEQSAQIAPDWSEVLALPADTETMLSIDKDTPISMKDGKLTINIKVHAQEPQGGGQKTPEEERQERVEALFKELQGKDKIEVTEKSHDDYEFTDPQIQLILDKIKTEAGVTNLSILGVDTPRTVKGVVKAWSFDVSARHDTINIYFDTLSIEDSPELISQGYKKSSNLRTIGGQAPEIEKFDDAVRANKEKTPIVVRGYSNDFIEVLDVKGSGAEREYSTRKLGSGEEPQPLEAKHTNWIDWYVKKGDGGEPEPKTPVETAPTLAGPEDPIEKERRAVLAGIADGTRQYSELRRADESKAPSDSLERVIQESAERGEQESGGALEGVKLLADGYGYEFAYNDGSKVELAFGPDRKMMKIAVGEFVYEADFLTMIPSPQQTDKPETIKEVRIFMPEIQTDGSDPIQLTNLTLNSLAILLNHPENKVK